MDDLRLKRNCDFEKVFKNGKRIFGKTLIFIYIKDKDLKIGYCVSKKHGKAVVRNRIKRLLRAAMREVIPCFNGNYHIVILPKTSDTYSFEVFLNDLKRIIKKEFSEIDK